MPDNPKLRCDAEDRHGVLWEKFIKGERTIEELYEQYAQATPVRQERMRKSIEGALRADLKKRADFIHFQQLRAYTAIIREHVAAEDMLASHCAIFFVTHKDELQRIDKKELIALYNELINSNLPKMEAACQKALEGIIVNAACGESTAAIDKMMAAIELAQQEGMQRIGKRMFQEIWGTLDLSKVQDPRVISEMVEKMPEEWKAEFLEVLGQKIFESK